MKYQKIVSVCFLLVIFICGILTFLLSFREVAGGLVRGYRDAPDEYNTLEKVGNGFGEFESRINEYFAFRNQSINSYGLIQNAIGRDLVDDVDKDSEVVKLKNGYLTFKEVSDCDISYLGEYIKALDSQCKEKGIDLVYINKVDKTTKDKSILPDDYPYIYNDNTEDIIKDMIENGVNVLDICSIVDEQGTDKYSLFYKSDHHWTPNTGIWVSKLIADILNSFYTGYNINSKEYDISNYNVDTYEKSFLGSQGKRVGVFYSEIDDFRIITPKDETEYTLTIEDENVYLEGSFEDVFIHREYIKPNDLLTMSSTPYMAYMNSNHSLVEIENKTINNGKSAVIVMDSFGCVVAPYISQSFSKVDCIDLRHFSGSLDEYILNTKPDVVLYMATNCQ